MKKVLQAEDEAMLGMLAKMESMETRIDRLESETNALRKELEAK